jgi:hypothetical protein
MDARSWFGMTFAKETPARHATPASAFGATPALPSSSHPWQLSAASGRCRSNIPRRPAPAPIPAARDSRDRRLRGSGTGTRYARVPKRCLGISRQRFAGLETGYRFSPGTDRPHQTGPKGSATGVARTPRTIPPMILVTAGMPRCGAAGIAGEKPSECGPLVFDPRRFAMWECLPNPPPAPVSTLTGCCIATAPLTGR